MDEPQEKININPVIKTEDLMLKNNLELIEITSKFIIILNIYSYNKFIYLYNIILFLF